MRKRTILKIAEAVAAVAGILSIVAFVSNKKEEKEILDDDNEYIKTFSMIKVFQKEDLYTKYIKRGLDVILSASGLVILSPVFVIISAAIYIDNPGPVIFKQKRLGKNCKFFYCHKFRTMKTSTPHDVPTHQLNDPDQYITRVGRVLRRTSLDEIPQCWDIFRNKMAVIGPRPALWNQNDLVAERAKYGANDMMPGLTGLAQIRGRDELEIPDKARIDGEYCKNIGFCIDCKCFLGTVKSVLKHDGVVEGGTGSMKLKFGLRRGVPEVDPESELGCDKTFQIDWERKVKVLITGTESYIGESFKAYAEEHYGKNFEIDAIDMRDESWRDYVFTPYDTVFHVAGIAHADVGNVSDEVKERYYRVNSDLAIETARKAKEEGVKQFIFMSSMIVYGGSEYIDRNTKPNPANFYGDSKWQADKGVREVEDSNFAVAVLRPPMVYGRGSKGNYLVLSKLARKLPVFPKYGNRRSMLYIENLCEFLSQLMISGSGGIFFPQNGEYSKTSEIVKNIASATNKQVYVAKLLSPATVIAKHTPIRKVRELANKAFGSSYYDQELSNYKGLDYQKITLEESIMRTER